jgi:DNA-binding transcriptional LysR family regulator
MLAPRVLPGAVVELRHLRYLVAVADAGTFVRAAELLRVAQPALTRQIHDLEEVLGVTIFAEGARKATLTPAGEACVRVARHVLKDLARAIARARLSKRGLAGQCVLMSGPLPVMSGFVARVIKRMKQKYPGISIEVQEGGMSGQWTALADAQADVGLGVPPTPEFPTLAYELQYVELIDTVLVAPEHPLAAMESVGLADLAQHQFLALDGHPEKLQQAVVGEMKRLRLRHSPPRQFSSFESLQVHIRAGQGWSLIPGVMVSGLRPLVGVRIRDFRAPFRNARIWRRTDQRPVVHTLLAELRAMEQESREGSVAGPTTSAPEPEEFISSRLELRHLLSFIAVAEYGSMGRAAEEVGITQPALSRQMRDLEYDVGVPLMQRESRGVALTDAGEDFLDSARGVLSLVEHLPREALRAHRGAAQNRCLIGVVPHPFVDRVLVSAINDLETRGERVRVGTRGIPTPMQSAALRNSEIDLAIGHAFPVPGPSTESRGLIVTRLFSEEMNTVLVAAGHPLAQRTEIRTMELVDVPFLYPARAFFPRMYDALHQRLADVGLTPRVDDTYDGLHIMWAMAAQGLGWTLGWTSHLTEPPAGLRAIPLLDFTMPWGVELVYRQDESRVSILAAIDAIVDCANHLNAKQLPEVR